MALSNTLYAGLSGLDVAQAKLNVVGNNIANVNTVAFKSTRTLIKPQFYVTDSGGAPPDGDNGGANPLQRGLGAVVADLERNFLPGSIESTGKPTDLAIDGEGFFIVESDERKYTRDGTFKLNPNNDLVTSAGDYVMGYAADDRFNLNTAQLTRLNIPLNVATTAQPTTSVRLQGNLQVSGDLASGASVLATQALVALGGGTPTGATTLDQIASATDPTTPLFAVGDVFTFSARKGSRDLPGTTFTVQPGATLDDLATFFREKLAINTTIPDDGDPLTPVPGVSLVPDGGGVHLQVVGNLGEENALTFTTTSFITEAGTSPFAFAESTTPAGVESDPVGESVHTSFVVYDSLGTPVTVSLTAALESYTSAGSVWRYYAESRDTMGGDLVVGTGTVAFDSSGQMRDTDGTSITISRAGTGAVTPLQINLDFSTMTALTSKDSELAMAGQDGLPIGRLTAFSIGLDGKITGSFSNGATRTVGQLALATFTNRQGLVDRGGNMFVEGANSGPAVIGTPGALSNGKIVSGSLELSNVDLSEEFINLIIASTGFQAASRVITTSDELLMALLNSR